MFTSLLDILSERAKYQSEQQAYIFLQNGETESGSLTYGELDRQARAIAAQIQSWQGERALLIYPSGLEFITAFFGCLYAGVVAVPVYPPRRNQNLSRLLSIVNDAQAKIALTTTSILPDLGQRWEEQPGLAQLKLIATDTLASNYQEFAPKLAKPDILAFLQYTSGSTGTPKGVMVSHANIIHNQRVIQQAFGNSDKTIFAGWLPLFHDMGLIGHIIQPMYLGILSILMPPVAFLQNPICWLKAISRYKATASGGPNFAYDLCVKKIKSEQLTNIDLSSWNVAFNASEPLRAETLEQFGKKLASCGFRYSAFYPCYGMAEATLFVTGGHKNQLPVIQGVKAGEIERNSVVESEISSSESKVFVGCGHTYEDTIVTIVNPKSLIRCEKGQIGEILVSGGSIASGYWNRPEATRETFQAYLKETGEGPFLRTGDLGFLRNRDLFVTGRIKDLIIIRGKNYYPQDIELTVQKSHPALRIDYGAAVSVDIREEEKLVVVQEVERSFLHKLDRDEVFKAICKAVSQEHHLQIHEIVLLKTASIPKTSSGKVQRYACRELFLKGGFKSVATWKCENITFSSQLSVSMPSISEQNSSQGQQTVNQQAVASNLVNMHQAVSDEISQKRADTLINWLREYGNDHINSHLIDERRCIPPHIVLDLGNQGIMGMQVPEVYGGLGLNNCGFVRVIEQLAAIDLSLATFVGTNNTLGIRPIQRYATPQMQQELLPMLSQGRELAAFAITEPDAGSAVRRISSKAVSNANGGWLLHGTKIWSGSSSWAGVVNIFVQRYDENQNPQGIVGFVVPRGTSGLRPGPEALTMGMRGMVQNTMYLDEVPVTAANLLGELDKGMEAAQDTMMFARLGIAVMSIGGMKRCAQLMHRYASRRTISTGCLLDNPVTLTRLSNLTAAITAAETFVNTIAEYLDKGKFVPEEAFIVCKTSAPEFLWQAADHLVQLLGGRGYVETNIAPQIFRNARLFRIFEGPTETLNMHLGSSVMHESEPLFNFLLNGLQAPNIAHRLRDTAARIQAHYLGVMAPFQKRSSALQWAHVLIGEITTYGLLLAAVQMQASTRTPSEELNRAVIWVQLQFEMTIEKALNIIPTESVILSTNNLTTTVANYVESIGDIEQTLPGEERELNELLRKSPSPKFVDRETRGQGEKETTKLRNKEDNIVLPSVTFATATTEVIQNWIVAWLSKELRVGDQRLDSNKSFADYGLDSVVAVELAKDLGDWLGQTLDATIAWNFPTIESLAAHLAQEMPSAIPIQPALKTNGANQGLDQLSEADLEKSIIHTYTRLENLLKDDE